MAKQYDDREIAKNAERRLTSALRSKTSSFKDHVNKPANEASLKDAFAKARLKQYGLVSNGSKSYYLRAISIVMAKHGYIYNYGVNAQRSAGSRTRHKPRSKTYHFKQHLMRQTAKPFLNQAINQSGVVTYVAQEIAKNRAGEVAEKIVVNLRHFND